MVTTTVIINAFNEPDTARKAIHAMIRQTVRPDRIVLVAPDDATLKVTNEPNMPLYVQGYRDAGKGKSASLNEIFKQEAFHKTQEFKFIYGSKSSIRHSYMAGEY